MSIRIVLISFAIVCLVVVVTMLPIEIPYSVSAYGKIVPARKWSLIKGNDGQLTAFVFNYESGLSEGYNTAQFAREGAMHFTLSPSMIAGGTVKAGDTVGTINSSETTAGLTDLMGQLAIARANLQAAKTGEKQPVIDECRRRLEWSKGQANQKHKELTRLIALNEKKLISEEEFEAATSEAQLLDIEVAVAQAQLDAATSGEKPEEIELIKTQITALEHEIAAMDDLVGSFSITAPFGGEITRGYATDTLLTIYDTSTVLAIIPILYIDRTHVKEGQRVVIETDDVTGEVYGHITVLENEIHLLNGNEVLMGVASLPVLPENATPGKIANCTINCEPVGLLEYARRFFRESVL